MPCTFSLWEPPWRDGPGERNIKPWTLEFCIANKTGIKVIGTKCSGCLQTMIHPQKEPLTFDSNSWDIFCTLCTEVVVVTVLVWWEGLLHLSHSWKQHLHWNSMGTSQPGHRHH